MARGRMLSKDISLDEKVDALSDDTARLLFTWMIPHLDCEGRIYGDAQIFKSIVAPRRNYSVRKIEKYLIEMENFGLIERYSVDGNLYICAPHFEKHQTGLRKDKEAPSKIPPNTPNQGRSKDRQTQLQVKEKFKLKRKEDKEEKNSSSSRDLEQINPSEEVAEIATLYEVEIGKITSVVAEELKEALKEYSTEQIKAAIKEAVCHNKRKWSYVQGILRNWKEHPAIVKKDDANKYSKQKYRHMVRH